MYHQKHKTIQEYNNIFICSCQFLSQSATIKGMLEELCMKIIYEEQYRQISLKIAYTGNFRAWTQEELAEQAGVTSAFIGHLEAPNSSKVPFSISRYVTCYCHRIGDASPEVSVLRGSLMLLLYHIGWTASVLHDIFSTFFSFIGQWPSKGLPFSSSF